MKCKDCQLCIGNDNGVYLCKFNSPWQITKPDNECYLDIKAKPITCGDCTGIDNDTGCIGCKEDDTCPQEGCVMNVLKGEVELHNFLERLESTGYDVEKYLKHVIKEHKIYTTKLNSRYKFQKDKNILCVYEFGEVTYGFKNAKSCWVVITKDSTINKDYFQGQDIIHFTKEQWSEEAKKNTPTFMQCIMTLPQYKLKEKYKPKYTIDKDKVYKEFLKQSQSYWDLGKKNFSKDPNAKKLLWNAFNLLFYAQDIICGGTIKYMHSLNTYNEMVGNKHEWGKFSQHYEDWYKRVKESTKFYLQNDND